MEPRGNPCCAWDVSRSPLPGNLQADSVELQGPGPARAEEPGRPEVALTSQPDTRSGHSTGRHGNKQRSPRACPGGRTSPAPQPSSECRVFPPGAPTATRSRTHSSPLPLKWVRPLPVDSNAEWSITRIPRGSRARALLGNGDGDHPPSQAVASRRPGCGQWARWGTRSGGGDAGEGGTLGRLFPRARPSVPPPETQHRP